METHKVRYRCKKCGREDYQELPMGLADQREVPVSCGCGNEAAIGARQGSGRGNHMEMKRV